MIQYKDYLDRIIEFYSVETEDNFNEVVSLFPKVQEIDWAEFYPDDSDVVYYILGSLVYSVDSGAYIDDYDDYTKHVCLDGVISLKELEDLKRVFDDNGWIIQNYEELKEEIENEEREFKELQAKENLIEKIRNNATLEQLQKFAEEL